MKRRSFLSLSALAAAVPATAAGQEAASQDWWDTVGTETLKFRTSSDEGNITLYVELFRPPEDEVQEITDGNGEFLHYRHDGKEMPPRFWPGQSMLVRFDLKWDGKPVPVAERFWSDLAGLDIQTSTLEPEKLKPELRPEAQRFVEGLRQPRLLLSAEGGTVLIEWERPEECDSRSMIRWIVSKSGNVLRHRFEPPHQCGG